MRIGLNLLHARPELGGGWNYIANLVEAIARADDGNEYVAFAAATSRPLVSGSPRYEVVPATMGRAQGLSSVLHAARLVAARAPRVQFVFVVGGVEAAALSTEAQEMGLPNVRFLPMRLTAEVGPLLAAADVLLVHLRDDPLFSITIPSKTQAYMASGRPILMAVRGDAADLVRAAGAGVCTAPEDPGALANAVCDLAAANPEVLSTMGEHGRAYYRQHLSREAGTARFEAVFGSVVADRN